MGRSNSVRLQTSTAMEQKGFIDLGPFRALLAQLKVAGHSAGDAAHMLHLLETSERSVARSKELLARPAIGASRNPARAAPTSDCEK